MDVLSGAIDLRTYPRRYVTVFANSMEPRQRQPGFLAVHFGGTLAPITDCIEWLDQHLNFELVTIFSNQATDMSLTTYAMLRRR